MKIVVVNFIRYFSLQFQIYKRKFLTNYIISQKFVAQEVEVCVNVMCLGLGCTLRDYAYGVDKNLTSQYLFI